MIDVFKIISFLTLFLENELEKNKIKRRSKDLILKSCSDIASKMSKKFPNKVSGRQKHFLSTLNAQEINKLSASFSDIHISNEKDNKENKSNRLNRNYSSNPSLPLTSSFATDSAVGSFQSSIPKQAPSNFEKKNYKKIQFNFSVVFK